MIADDSALDALMSQFPASPSDAPATKTDIALLTSDIALLKSDLRTEIRDGSIRTISVMITAMIALNGVTVGLVAGVMAALG